MGGALGDALGAPIEFSSIGAIRAQYGPDGVTGLVAGDGMVGLVTDDTQMTLFTLEGLLRADVRFVGKGICHVPSVVRFAYLRWLDTQEHSAPPPRDGDDDEHFFRDGWLREQRWLYARRAPGNACLSGLRTEFGRSASFGRPGPVNPGSKGCGTVMRSAPFGLGGAHARQTFEMAAECAQITHGHPTGYLAAGAFAALIQFLVQGSPLPQAVAATLDLLAEYPSHQETTQALCAAVALAGDGDPSPEKVERLGGAWVAEEALAIAVYCALAELPAAPSRGGGFGSYRGISRFQRALLLAVNHSGDSDSTGAMVGNILGAAHGDLVLPGDWLVQLEGRAVITELADDFATQMADGCAMAHSTAWFTKYPGG
ncbi:ADP-ribosylglycohydrolase family protein [Microbispora oryzae]|uniref:ADP-ribosylglycohydrolase family protein n=1 Tax=Microbispora oryzae TaxID=2806554 RepID=UPI001E585F47|nr:ADP-ribosylglycohydrolase family protein [Microbispora oryzae]